MREPVVIMGGFLTDPGDYISWKEKLAAPPYSRRVFIAVIGRIGWAVTRDDSFEPQINALEAAVKRARETTGAEKVWIVGHSAGGRVARLWMGDLPYNGKTYGGHKYVRGLISLGSPYLTKEPWAIKSAAFANTNYPGAFYKDIKYVTAIGRSVIGKKNGSLAERFAYKSYQLQEPEKPEQWGDGVITIQGALMPGTENHILPGIYHYGLFGKPDYSHPAAMKIWAKYLAEEDQV